MGGVRFTEEWVREYRKKREAESRNSDETGGTPHQSRRSAEPASNYGIAATGSYGRLDSLRVAPPPGEAIRAVTAENSGDEGGGAPHPIRLAAGHLPPVGEGFRGAKYGNEKVCRGGKRFDSKHEAAVYEELRLRCMAGEYLGLGLQVAFYLPGGIKYLADFVAITKDGGIEVMDAKSEATRRDKVYRLKKRLMKECLGLEIIEV